MRIPIHFVITLSSAARIAPESSDSDADTFVERRRSWVVKMVGLLGAALKHPEGIVNLSDLPDHAPLEMFSAIIDMDRAELAEQYEFYLSELGEDDIRKYRCLRKICR
jgi:hypothetical protein